MKHLLAALLLAVAVSAAPLTTDFSHAGYGGGGVPLPDAAARVQVEPTGRDDTLALQGAINAVSALPLNPDGLRGAIVLRPGTYRVSGTLRIRASGVVLRGQGATLVASGRSRRTLIEVQGSALGRSLGEPVPVIADTVAGATTLQVNDSSRFQPGTRVLVRRQSTEAWIHRLGMNQFTGRFKDTRLDWLPGTRDLEWERTVTAVDAETRSLSLDGPITSALDRHLGGGTVHTLQWPDRLSHVGIENLVCISEYDGSRPTDEEHAWICVSLDHLENAWVQGLTARHFVSAAVWIGRGARAVTVEDARSEAPVSENAGWRRLAFYTRGQQVLFLRCVAEGARQPFIAGFCAAGPNVFLDCTATGTLADSGSFESWTSGALFENVTLGGGGLVLGNLGERWQGAGWNAGDSVVWNCSGGTIQVDSPPGATNRLHTSQVGEGLYRRQLKERRGTPALAALVRGSVRPKGDQPAGISASPAPSSTPPLPHALEIAHGTLRVGGAALFGTATSNAWWRGQTVPARAGQLGYHPMRWAPGLHGPGLTEDLESLVTALISRDQRLLQVGPGLSYDRRRDDHTLVERDTPEVWAPFFEMPWARSGQGRAADGLSKYDLKTFNPWYFERLLRFAHIAGSRGAVIYHHLYNHHNLVESGEHWVDFPWRGANCIQQTDLAEPPALVDPGRRISFAEAFYDIDHPVRRELHTLYIRHCLETLKECPNVIHTVGFQFAGPLRFQQFFLDTVAAWEKERGVQVRLALNTSKAITDAILGDPTRAAQVDVVDQRYWQYLQDGTLFAPHSDGARTFREDRVAAFGKDVVPPGTPGLVYAQVREYRERYPEKAVISHHAQQGPLPVLLAGGFPLLADYSAAQPLRMDRDDRALFHFLRERAREIWHDFKPVASLPEGTWGATGHARWLLYSTLGDAIPKPSSLLGRRAVGTWINPATGEALDLRWDGSSQIRKPSEAPWALWIRED